MEDWRRIDIDALDPENFISAEELTPEVPPVSSQEVQSKITNIRTLISKGSHSDAITLAVEEPPYGADEESKVCSHTFVKMPITNRPKDIIPQCCD
jgi:actin related protein 2/3 complex subunit 5